MVPKEIFPKWRPGIKLNQTRENGDGNEVEVEVRENEEQTFKFQEIVDLLVAAGYFRARIKGLSPFDKVVGGMTWCIESCNFDVDVDLLFQENSTIGQKIALTEKIVAVLPKMKCPCGIEPHQIQGLDFIHIFPVIQWLVKRSMEFRQETCQFVRLNAINQFSKIYVLEEETRRNERISTITTNVRTVRDLYRPQRQYRLKHTPPTAEIDRVQVTLLEYGHRCPVVSIRAVAESQPSVESMEQQQSEEELRVDGLLKNMTETEEQDDFEFILNPEERAELKRHYATLQAEMQDGGLKSREERQLAHLQTQKLILMERIKKLTARKAEMHEKVNSNTSVLEETKEMQLEASARLNKLEGISNDSDVEKLEQLIVINESLREQEEQFKEQCRLELDNFQKMISDAQQVVPKPDMSSSEAQLLEYESQIQTLRLAVAKKNRFLAQCQRQLDDVPSRAELAQYQRRFVELYNQVAAKHKETKQYFTLYNTLDDTKMYITKELSLLNSILDNYPEAMASNSGKEEFVQQLEQIVEGVKQTKTKVAARRAEEQVRRDDLSKLLQSLIAQQRQYVTIVKQLSIECRQHEALLTHIKSS